MDRVPIQQVSKEKTAEPKGHEGVWKETASFMDDINYHRMADFLEISYEERKDSNLAEKLSFLTDWAKETGKTEDKSEQKLMIRQLGKNLGLTAVGKELVHKLYQYIRLDNDRKKIEKEMQLVSQ